jgi:glycosyltransferase involved in cell wall biosynthesis
MGLESIDANSLVIGVVATNQARKDWALAFETAALLNQRNHVLMWIHVDHMSRYWDIVALVRAYGLVGRVLLTQSPMSEDDLAQMYSACNATLGIGLGEGFGYPIFESLACGVPCVHGNYGGAAEHLHRSLLVEPRAFRVDGYHGCLRPVFNAEDWASAVSHSINPPAGDDKDMIPEWKLPDHLDWNNLWPRWKSWIKEGLNDRIRAAKAGSSSPLSDR